MAASKTTDTKADTAARASTTEPEPPTTQPTEEQQPAAEPRVSDCVVNEGRGKHVGRAVNGKVCSYHAMRYKADGTRR